MDDIAKDSWPFEAWLRLAVTQMHLSPQAFWTMDVCDWLMLCARPQAQPLKANEFDDLMALYPDAEVTHDSE